MRYDWFDSVIVGGSIALAILAIQTLADGAPGQARLLLLLLAGAVLAGLQLVLTLRRTRRGASEQPPQSGRPAPDARTDRRNPFIRELTRDWTGLDDRGLAPGPPRSARRELDDAAETADQPLSAPLPAHTQDTQDPTGAAIEQDGGAEQPAHDR